MEGAHLASESVDFHCVRRMTMPMRTVLIILFTAIRAASAGQEKSQDSYYVERYAGTYSADCDDEQVARLEVLADRLIFSDGDSETVAYDLGAILTWCGQFPPDGFVVALSGVADRRRRANRLRALFAEKAT